MKCQEDSKCKLDQIGYTFLHLPNSNRKTVALFLEYVDDQTHDILSIKFNVKCFAIHKPVNLSL
jgi:hypothetical protein